MKSRTRPQNLVSRRRAIERRFGSLAQQIWEFAEPHLEPSGRSFEVQRVFSLAVAAWNLPFLDTARRNEVVRDTPAADSLLLFDLYVRRLKEYPDDPRVILEHDLLELGAGAFSPLVRWAEGVFRVERG
jgi:hypothetical protein